MLKKFQTHPRRPLLNNPWAHRHRRDQFWSLPGDLNRKFEHAPHCRKVRLKLDLWLWSRNKATIVVVEEPTITKSKNGAAGLEFNREHAHCFFRREEDCSPWIWSS
jgi:hypothetical protein